MSGYLKVATPCILLSVVMGLIACKKHHETNTTPPSPTVYVLGSSGDTTEYWKNGVATDLTDGIYDAYASSVYVSGTDVYVAGYEKNDSVYVAKLWKNGVVTNLTNGKDFASATSVYVSGKDVYVAGVDSGITKLRKNGKATNLTDRTICAYTTVSVFVK